MFVSLLKAALRVQIITDKRNSCGIRIAVRDLGEIKSFSRVAYLGQC